MNDHPCIRCHHPVPLEDGHLSYCSHCGAPQIFLSEDMQAEIARLTEGYNERNLPEPPRDTAPAEPAPRRWGLPGARSVDLTQHGATLAVQYALLSAGITLALGLLTLLFPPVGILMLLWVVSAPILTVAFCNARMGGGRPTTSGYAARLGLLTALLVAVCCALIFTLSLVMTRFVFHDAALLDSQLAASFQQQRAAALQRLGASVQPTLDMLAIPEFRVGLLLSMSAISATIYVCLSTVAAGLAGAVLRRRRNV